jgi:hypothetical protein
MDTSLRLIAPTDDAQGQLIHALNESGVACRARGKMVIVEARDKGVSLEHMIAAVRSALATPEREAVSVVEDLEFPNEFPVTTRLEAWWSVCETGSAVPNAKPQPTVV